jgi:acyl carrier protein
MKPDTSADETVGATLAGVLVRHLRRVPDGDWSSVPLADLGLDSMTAIEVVVGVEEAFGVEFPEELLVRETFVTRAALEAAVRGMVSG